jgi:biotin carboxylase
VIGATCPDEGLLLPAAIAVEALGLPGPSAEAVAACRDKKLSRERLTAAGLPQPRHSTASSPEELAEVAADLGYPVVLKPRALGGSAGVIKVSNPDEVASAYAVATAAGYPGIEHSANVVVEQYLEGPEISIDGSMFGLHDRAQGAGRAALLRGDRPCGDR